MKYYNYQITTSEIPDEITLCINITNCPIHCTDCHSKFLWEDVGVELTKEEIFNILDKNPGISCVCLMGGDADYRGLHNVIIHIREWMSRNRKYLKLALYSGRLDVQDLADRAGTYIGTLNYIKIGPYVSSLGGLDNKETNQRLYLINPNGDLLATTDTQFDDIHIVIRGFDITHKFWR